MFLSSADFSKSIFPKSSFRNTIRVPNILDPDQARHFVRLDLGPNCLQRLSADDTSRQRVNTISQNNGMYKFVISWNTTSQIQLWFIKVTEHT